jgi:flagellar biosynthesis/type III secretory pathway protein FliH
MYFFLRLQSKLVYAEQKGEQRGMQKGLQRGMQKGLQEGKQEMKQEIISLLKSGKSPEEIIRDYSDK